MSTSVIIGTPSQTSLPTSPRTLMMEITGLSSGISSSSFHPSSAYAISRGLTILPTLIEPTCSSLPWYQLHPLPAHSDYPCSHHTSLPLLPTLCSHPHSRHRHILASPITHTSPPPASLPLPMTSTNSWDNLPPHTCILSAHIVPCDIPPTTVPPVSLSLSLHIRLTSHALQWHF